jgi:phosphate ABC transporter permease protein PstC
MEAGSLTARGGRSILERPSRSRALDPALRYALTALAVLILVLIAFFFIRLFVEAKPAFDKFGYFGFVFDNNWDVSRSIYGSWPLLVGTLITSALALAMGVPVAIATAVYLTELCPRRLRQPLTILVELLAAVPSVVYGLWGIKVLAPHLKGPEQWFSDTFSFLPLVGGTVSIPNYFIAGLILAIMIVPIVSAISREVMATVPTEHKEAALALGATRWETIRIAVLPYSRAGSPARRCSASAARSARRSRSRSSSATRPTSASRSSRRATRWPPSSPTSSARPRRTRPTAPRSSPPGWSSSC